MKLYPTNDAPRYITGHAVTMSLVAMASLIYATMFFYFTQENKKRQSGVHNDKIEGLTEEEILTLGDENPRFKFAR